MNREDIIGMAREAGFLCDEDWVTYGLPGFERFAALVAAAERRPLTDEQIERLGLGNYRQVVRETERAHGIGDEA